MCVQYSKSTIGRPLSLGTRNLLRDLYWKTTTKNHYHLVLRRNNLRNAIAEKPEIANRRALPPSLAVVRNFDRSLIAREAKEPSPEL